MRHTLSGQVLYPFYSLISCTSFNSSSGALGFSFLAINIANKGRLRYQLLRNFVVERVFIYSFSNKCFIVLSNSRNKSM